MTDNQIIASCAVLLALIMLGLLFAALKLNAIPQPTYDQRRFTILVEALTAVSIGATLIVTIILLYRLLALPLWIFIGIFG